MKRKGYSKTPFDPAVYPALRNFLPAYLHQDFADEYGSAADAANAFVNEASADEVGQVKQEWRSLRQAFGSRPLKDFKEALRRLGSGWSPVDEAEVKGVDEILSSTQA